MNVPFSPSLFHVLEKHSRKEPYTLIIEAANTLNQERCQHCRLGLDLVFGTLHFKFKGTHILFEDEMCRMVSQTLTTAAFYSLESWRFDVVFLTDIRILPAAHTPP